MEQLVLQAQVAITHNSQTSLPLAAAAAVPSISALLQVDLAVAPAHQIISSLEPMAHQVRALLVEIHPLLTTQPMVQVVADQEVLAKMA